MGTGVTKKMTEKINKLPRTRGLQKAFSAACFFSPRSRGVLAELTPGELTFALNYFPVRNLFLPVPRSRGHFLGEGKRGRVRQRSLLALVMPYTSFRSAFSPQKYFGREVSAEEFSNPGSRGRRGEAFLPSPAPCSPSCSCGVLGRARYLRGDGCGIASHS